MMAFGFCMMQIEIERQKHQHQVRNYDESRAADVLVHSLKCTLSRLCESFPFFCTVVERLEGL